MERKNKKIITTISLICEGETEESFIKYLKNEILKSKFSKICINHTKTFDGGYKKEKIKTNLQCCETYVIIDDDNKNLKEVQWIEKDVTSKSANLIINKPLFEIVLLSLFKEIKKIKWTKKEIEKELEKIIGEKYKHSNICIKKLCERFNKNNLFLFEKNLDFLKKNKLSDFLDLYNKFLRGKNEIK